MADQTQASRPKGKGKEFLGQPAWLWAVGGLVVVGGYLYLKSKAAKPASQAGGGKTGGGRPFVSPTGLSTETFTRWITDHQGQPHRRPPPASPDPHRPRRRPPRSHKPEPPRKKRGV